MKNVFTNFLPRLRSLKYTHRPQLVVTLLILGGSLTLGTIAFISHWSKVKAMSASSSQVAGAFDSKIPVASASMSSGVIENKNSKGNLMSSETSGNQTGLNTNQANDTSGQGGLASSGLTSIGGDFQINQASPSVSPTPSGSSQDPELQKELDGLEQELSTLESNGDFDNSPLSDF